MHISLIVCLIVVAVAMVYLANQHVAHEVSVETQDEFRRATLYGFTSKVEQRGYGKVEVAPAEGFMDNISTFGKPCISFSTEEPTLWDMAKNTLAGRKTLVKVRFVDLNPKNIRLRGIDGAIVHVGAYVGAATVSPSMNQTDAVIMSIRRRLTSRRRFAFARSH